MIENSLVFLYIYSKFIFNIQWSLLKKVCKLQIIAAFYDKINISWEAVFMVKRKERLSEGKKNIIADLIREYDI